MNAPACFLYGSLLDPALLEGTAPNAEFDRIAHLPAHRLTFSHGGRPVVVEEEGHTVWGGIFRIPDDEIEKVGSAELGPAGDRRTAWAVDRDGERVEVVVFSGDDGGRADEERVNHMVAGARHWDLPTGWIVGLEDLVDPFEL